MSGLTAKVSMPNDKQLGTTYAMKCDVEGDSYNIFLYGDYRKDVVKLNVKTKVRVNAIRVLYKSESKKGLLLGNINYEL